MEAYVLQLQYLLTVKPSIPVLLENASRHEMYQCACTIFDGISNI